MTRFALMAVIDYFLQVTQFLLLTLDLSYQEMVDNRFHNY